MTAKSEFDLLRDRYVMRNDKPEFFVIAQNYGGPLVDKIRELEMKRGADYAFEILKGLSTGNLQHALRKAHNLDVIKATAFITAEQQKFSRGSKYRCGPCNQNFYDRLREDATCPKCGKAKTDCIKITS